MFYQSFKYILVRTGLTLFLVLVFGYLSLYFVHEVALPDVYFNDLWIKWMVVGICLFFGFVVYGIFGEHRFLKALDSLKHIDLKTAGPEIRDQFQTLVEFTGSSYFLPGQGRELREQLVQDYAEFLMSTGSEDPEALNVFLKAYLQDLKQNRFRNVLVSALTRKQELTEPEIDLLLVIMKTEDYEDRSLLNHMVTVFLDQEWFTNKSEPVFLKALQLKTGQEDKIISFMLPHLLDKKRTDYLAVNFYLESLSSLPEEQQGTLTFLVSTCYCEDRFKVLDPDLHMRCQQVFDSLEPQTKTRLLHQVREAKVLERWKGVRLFHSDDKRALERLKVYTGLSPTFWQVVGKKISMLGGGVFNVIKKGVFKVFDGLNLMGGMNTATKLVVAGLMVGGIFYAAVAVDWKSMIQSRIAKPPPPAPLKKPVEVAPATVFTIQIAAVKSQDKAEETVQWLKKKNVKEVNVVKTPRTTEGFWYKVRVGKFDNRDAAEQFAKSLLQKKVIRSYFIIALDGHSKT